ncbi:MAG TPA: sigma-70 family RNA polymerase sigma factor [Solirubrobacteraceae bacterium]|nr:sigma-70 family RNA polymerase sigma factor [Solirubrobacteraceae bacterium]
MADFGHWRDVVADRMDLTHTTDDELLGAIAVRDGEAFTVFYRRHLPVALAYLMRETRDPELAADLAAEVFADVLLTAHRYLDHGITATPWVIGIARNKLLMSLRRGRVEAKARTRLGFEPVALDDADLERVVAMADDGEGPLQALMDELPDDERRAVLSRVVHERSDGDIASELSCSEMVVRKRVSRGLSRLRERLGGS